MRSLFKIRSIAAAAFRGAAIEKEYDKVKSTGETN